MSAFVLLADQLEVQARTLMAQAEALREMAARPMLVSAPRLLTVSEICERWSTGETLVRGLIRKGALSAVRIGDAVRVPHASIEAYERRNTKGRRDKEADGGAAAPERGWRSPHTPPVFPRPQRSAGVRS